MTLEQCSEAFADVFDSHGGGCRRDCACGRTYFDDSIHGHWDWAIGERDDLRERALANPDKCIAMDHTIGTMQIGGIEIVYGCTCGTAKRYENFILTHSELLAEYLNRKAAELREKATSIEVPSHKRAPLLKLLRAWWQTGEWR